MDKRQIIGFVLIMALFLVWSVNDNISRKRIEREKFVQDSIAKAEQKIVESDTTYVGTPSGSERDVTPDSVKVQALKAQYGTLAESFSGTNEQFVLENEDVKITFSSKGGKIVDVLVKGYKKVIEDEHRIKSKVDLHLLDDKKNKFSFELPFANQQKTVDSEDLYFDAKVSGQSILFTTKDGAFQQRYSLGKGYELEYDLNFDKNAFRAGESVQLNWVNYLDKLELNDYFERFYSSVYFKETDEGTDYCNCRSDDTESPKTSLDWVSHVNQFFNTTLMTEGVPFEKGVLTTKTLDENDENLKLVTSEILIPSTAIESGDYKMKFYLGPNVFETLKAYDRNLEDIVPFGRSIFGTINRWVIRPFFNFLDGLINNKGIAIILMILIVKMLLYPLTYKMLKSQALMGALKPELKGLKDKYKDDPQTQQVETMKIYREYGVSPLGGCFPMLVQMPIWYALFRFFPASIGFRQESFWWADDLSSYDSFFQLPFDIPMLGAHLSLFTLLWVISQLIYTHYNTKHMDMSANPAMKYVQYFMPVMFLVFFNQYASGLTVYMFFSNLITIAQTIVTKQFVFKEDKLRAILMTKKAKPKKKSKFQARIEEAMEQQRKANEAKKGGKRR